ncbi:MAG: DUF4173 domain-containing protein [Lachnospiraceae bacterium]|nr:DUF4173 domain-containing protein [Lachnospiraceae bacterium]
MISFLLHQFYDDSKWGFGKYLASMIATLFGSIGEVTKPFTDFMHYRSRNGKKSGKGIYVLVGACVSVPMVLVVWFLLMSADRVFMDMSEGLFDAINPDNIFGMVCSFVLMFLAAYGVLAYLGEKHLGEEVKEVKRMESALAITVMVPLTLLYIVFCGVQVFCLFLGNVELTNMTYAEYARQGFFQLLFICILNLIMVLVGRHYFKESKVLKGIMTVVSVCTYIMIFSSAFRMVLYIKHYYLTFLRILVLWALAVIFMLLTGVLISIYVRKFPLFRYGVIVVSVCYIALSFSKPDYWIATCNLGNVEKAEESFFDADAYQDYRYLSELSADAAPAILPYLEEKGYNIAEGTWGYRYLKDLRESVEDMSFREWNFSKYMAVKNLQQYE